MTLARVAVLLLSVLIATLVCAAQSGCIKETVAVGVSMRDGTSAPDLSPAMLRGTFARKPVSVKSVAHATKLPRIILLIDTSGSMNVHNDEAIDAAERLLANAPPAAEIGLAFFSKDLIPVALPTTNRATLVAQLEALRKDRDSYKGRTALWAAVRGSIKMFGDAQLGDVVYLISDGGENASDIGGDHVEGALGSAGVRLFALILQSGSPGSVRPPWEYSGPAYVTQMVQDSGGTTLTTNAQVAFHAQQAVSWPLVDKRGRPTEFGLTLDRQLEHLLNFYRAEIEVPEPVDKPQEWKLDLVGLTKSQRNKLVLTYPALLLPCR
jgi:hypothetical protein